MICGTEPLSFIEFISVVCYVIMLHSLDNWTCVAVPLGFKRDSISTPLAASRFLSLSLFFFAVLSRRRRSKQSRKRTASQSHKQLRVLPIAVIWTLEVSRPLTMSINAAERFKICLELFTIAHGSGWSDWEKFIFMEKNKRARFFSSTAVKIVSYICIRRNLSRSRQKMKILKIMYDEIDKTTQEKRVPERE